MQQISQLYLVLLNQIRYFPFVIVVEIFSSKREIDDVSCQHFAFGEKKRVQITAKCEVS